MEFHRDVVQYFQSHHVSVVMLLRRNVLRRLVSIMANSHDRKMRGTEHISHTNDVDEVRKLPGMTGMIPAVPHHNDMPSSGTK